jgi:hypothetical protein
MSGVTTRVIAPFHSITSPAVAINTGGTEMSNASAVLRLIHQIEPLRPLYRQVTRLGAFREAGALQEQRNRDVASS